LEHGNLLYLNDGDEESKRFPATRDGFDDDILVPPEDLETGLLNRRRMGEAHGGKIVQNPLGQTRGQGVP